MYDIGMEKYFVNMKVMSDITREINLKKEITRENVSIHIWPHISMYIRITNKNRKTENGQGGGMETTVFENSKKNNK